MHAKRVVEMRDGRIVADHRIAPVIGPPPHRLATRELAS